MGGVTIAQAPSFLLQSLTVTRSANFVRRRGTARRFDRGQGMDSPLDPAYCRRVVLT